MAQCKYESIPEACQTLANLCVLQLYNEATEACTAYKDIARTKIGTDRAIIDW